MKPQTENIRRKTLDPHWTMMTFMIFEQLSRNKVSGQLNHCMALEALSEIKLLDDGHLSVCLFLFVFNEQQRP